MKIKLFCIPFAGGSASAFRAWEKKLNNCYEVCPFEYSGHGARFVEDLYTKLVDMVNDVFDMLKKQIPTDGDYAILGYSMGATIAYEIVLRLQRESLKLPKHIFFCAQEAPQLLQDKHIYKLGKKKFIEEVLQLGGTAPEVMENEELLEIYEAILRSDYEAIETYKMAGMKKVNVNSSLLYGTEDHEITDIHAWKEVVDGELDIFSFKSGHFFVNDCEEEMLSVIRAKVENK